MPTVRLGAVFGALCLLGSCVTVDSEPPVSGSKQIQQLTSHEVVYVCDWSVDYMGGELSNPDEATVGQAIVHRCPGDIGIPGDDIEVGFVSFDYGECAELLAPTASAGCTLTVSEFADWIKAIADAPCQHHYVSNGQCAFIWELEEQMQ